MTEEMHRRIRTGVYGAVASVPMGLIRSLSFTGGGLLICSGIISPAELHVPVALLLSFSFILFVWFSAERSHNIPVILCLTNDL